jgi:hypothetical protein
VVVSLVADMPSDAHSLLLLIREDKPVLCDEATVRWLGKTPPLTATCSCGMRPSSSTCSTAWAGTTRSPPSGSSGGFGRAAATTKRVGLHRTGCATDTGVREAALGISLASA